MKKKILVFFSVIAVILVSIFSVVPKVNADTNVVIEYDEYNYVISITQIDSDYIYFFVVSHIENNVWSDSPSSDLSYAENHDQITSYGTYLVNASLLNNTSALYYYFMYIDEAILLQSYLNTATNGISTQSYNYGYTTGYGAAAENDTAVAFNTGKQDAYNSLVPGEAHYDFIYDKATADTSKYYESGQPGYQAIYNYGYQKALNDYDEIISDDPEDLNFLTMFKVIVNYITDFFRVGLNVEIFGVNIGNFCIGIFILSAVLFLIRLIFGR